MATRTVESDTCESEPCAALGPDAQQSVGSTSSQPKGVSAQGRSTVDAHECGPDTESDPEPPVTRARTCGRVVTNEAHDTTSDSDACDITSVKPTHERGEWISLDNLRLMCHESINEPEVRENYDYDLYIIA